nr:uncharacterized protein LOC128688542 [Cherax quadricarinatus]
MVHLLVTRIPEVYESTEAPPTPLAESLLNLLMKPLTFACAVNDSTLLSCVIEELCQDVFGGAAHSQICNFVIPCLASSSKYKLPMDRIVAVLGSRSLKFLDSCPAPSLLYSLLMLVHSSAGLMHQGSNTDSTSDDSDIGNTSSDGNIGSTSSDILVVFMMILVLVIAILVRTVETYGRSDVSGWQVCRCHNTFVKL